MNSRDLKIPVIFLTGQGSYAIDMAAMQGGAADYLIKDQVDAPLLERSIRYAIEQKKVQEELEVRVRVRTAELEEANRDLKAEISRRKEVECELRSIQTELEDRVIERTAELTEANQRLDAIFNHIAEAVTVYDERGFLLKANQSAVETLGIDTFSLEQGIQINRFSFYYLDGSPVPAEQVPTVRAMQGETIRQEPYLLSNGTGKKVQILFSATPMMSDGRLSGVVTITHDVTEREQLLAQLAVEQARLQAVIENAASGIVVADGQGKVILSNPMADKTLGGVIASGFVTEDHLTAVICNTGITPDRREDEILTRAALKGEVFTNVELLVQPGEDEARYLLANVTPIYDSRGQRNGAVGVFQDITSRKQMEEDLQRRVGRGQLIASLSGALAEAGLNDRAVLDTVTHQIAERVGDACIIWLLSEDGESLEPVSFYIKQAKAQQDMRAVLTSAWHGIKDGPSGYVLRTGKSLLLSELSTVDVRQSIHPQYWEWLEKYPVHSLLATPLRLKDRPIGVLMLLRFKSNQGEKPNHGYQPDDLTFFEDLAGRTALAIENARLYEEVQRLSVTDPLTGLYNRRGLETLSEHELLRARRNNQPVSVIVLDIDHFKKVNDTFGHPVGDEVLRELSIRLRDSLRNQDILARYGGEEFAILLPDCNAEMAFSIANRLRKLFNHQPVKTTAGAVSITISLGVVVKEQVRQSLPELVDQADAVLYRAKQNGRNRVEID